MTEKKNLTAEYAVFQGLYWMTFCIAFNYAAVFLQGFGYSNTAIGVVTALGNIAGAVFGPVAVSLGEREKRPGTLVLSIIGLQGLLLCAMRIINTRCLPLSICFTAFLSLCLITNSMALALFTACEKKAVPLNYPLARGFGSICFVISSAVLGVVAENSGASVIPVIGTALIVLELATVAVLLSRMRVSGAFVDVASSSEAKASVSGFVSRNRRYCLMLLCMIPVFISQGTACSFLINIVRNVGGDASVMGYLTAFMGLMEAPAMMFYAKFSKGKRDALLLKLSFVFFAVKAVLFALASNIAMLFFAQLFQMLSFGLYTAAIVAYAARVLAPSDAAKGQSLAYSMTLTGSVLAGIIAGPLLDSSSVSAVLWINAALSAAGALGCLACIGKRRAQPA